MTDSVYDITPADGPVHGWHPGAPGNEVGGGRRAARLAAAAAAAASHPTSPDVAGAVVPPPAASPVYDLTDDAAWPAPVAPTPTPAWDAPLGTATTPAPAWDTPVDASCGVT